MPAWPKGDCLVCLVPETKPSRDTEMWLVTVLMPDWTAPTTELIGARYRSRSWNSGGSVLTISRVR